MNNAIKVLYHDLVNDRSVLSDGNVIQTSSAKTNELRVIGHWRELHGEMILEDKDGNYRGKLNRSGFHWWNNNTGLHLPPIPATPPGDNPPPTYANSSNSGYAGITPLGDTSTGSSLGRAVIGSNATHVINPYVDTAPVVNHAVPRANTTTIEGLVIPDGASPVPGAEYHPLPTTYTIISLSIVGDKYRFNIDLREDNKGASMDSNAHRNVYNSLREGLRDKKPSKYVYVDRDITSSTVDNREAIKSIILTTNVPNDAHGIICISSYSYGFIYNMEVSNTNKAIVHNLLSNILNPMVSDISKPGAALAKVIARYAETATSKVDTEIINNYLRVVLKETLSTIAPKLFISKDTDVINQIADVGAGIDSQGSIELLELFRGELHKIIRRLTNRDSINRFQSASELIPEGYGATVSGITERYLTVILNDSNLEIELAQLCDGKLTDSIYALSIHTPTLTAFAEGIFNSTIETDDGMKVIGSMGVIPNVFIAYLHTEAIKFVRCADGKLLLYRIL